MPSSAEQPGPHCTPNQVVARNLREARTLRGLTQEEAAGLLAPYLGVHWSKSTFSAAERSFYAADRVREFSADEIFAMAQAFELPIAWFFLPPTRAQISPLPSADEPAQVIGPQEMLGMVFPGTTQELLAEFDRRFGKSGSCWEVVRAFIGDLILNLADHDTGGTADRRMRLGLALAAVDLLDRLYEAPEV